MIETQKQNFALQLAQHRQTTAAHVEHIRERQGNLETSVPKFKEHIDQYKQELQKEGSLVVSEEKYVEIKRKGPQRSLKEEMQLKVYESLESYLRDIDNLRREK